MVERMMDPPFKQPSMSIYSSPPSFSAIKAEENKQVIVTQLTTVRGGHHGLTVVLAGTNGA